MIDALVAGRLRGAPQQQLTVEDRADLTTHVRHKMNQLEAALAERHRQAALIGAEPRGRA